MSKSTWEQRGLFQLTSSSSSMRTPKGSSRRRDNGWMLLTRLPFLCLSYRTFLFRVGTRYPPPTVGWTHTNQLALKKMHQSHDHRAVWSRHFFNWGSLILSVPSFLSSWLLKLTIILAVIFCFIYCCFIYYLVTDYFSPYYRNPI